MVETISHHLQMKMQKVFTYDDGHITSTKLDLDGFIPMAKKCPRALLNDPEVKGKKLRPYVNGNDDTDIVYVTVH